MLKDTYVIHLSIRTIRPLVLVQSYFYFQYNEIKKVRSKTNNIVYLLVYLRINVHKYSKYISFHPILTLIYSPILLMFFLIIILSNLIANFTWFANRQMLAPLTYTQPKCWEVNLQTGTTTILN